jgi:hypothetical protein
MKRQFGLVTILAMIATFVFGSAGTVGAASTVVVTPPVNSQGWSTADTASGGQVNFVTDATAPAGAGALQLMTDATTASKAQYMHAANTPLSSVTELSYYTKQVSASLPVGDPSYQLPVNLNGTSGFTTLVFEPYFNPTQGPVVSNVWQKWNVATGLFWSSRTVTCSGGTVTGTPGGPASYTLSQIETLCPNAVVIGFGVDIGSNNPSYNVETDLVDFNGTTYNFEPNTVATNKDQCKDGGWQTFNPPNGPYKNQGQCVSSTNHQGGDNV